MFRRKSKSHVAATAAAAANPQPTEEQAAYASRPTSQTAELASRRQLQQEGHDLIEKLIEDYKRYYGQSILISPFKGAIYRWINAEVLVNETMLLESAYDGLHFAWDSGITIEEMKKAVVALKNVTFSYIVYWNREKRPEILKALLASTKTPPLKITVKTKSAIPRSGLRKKTDDVHDIEEVTAHDEPSSQSPSPVVKEGSSSSSLSSSDTEEKGESSSPKQKHKPQPPKQKSDPYKRNREEKKMQEEIKRLICDCFTADGMFLTDKFEAVVACHPNFDCSKITLEVIRERKEGKETVILSLSPSLQPQQQSSSTSTSPTSSQSSSTLSPPPKQKPAKDYPTTSLEESPPAAPKKPKPKKRKPKNRQSPSQPQPEQNPTEESPTSSKPVTADTDKGTSTSTTRPTNGETSTPPTPADQHIEMKYLFIDMFYRTSMHSLLSCEIYFTLVVTKQFSSAIDQLRQAASSDLSSQLLLGILLWGNTTTTSEGMAKLTELATKSPSISLAEVIVCIILEKENKLGELVNILAEKAADPAKKNTMHIASKYILATSIVENKSIEHYPLAIQMFEDILNGAPNNHRVRLYLANLYAQQSNADSKKRAFDLYSSIAHNKDHHLKIQAVKYLTLEDNTSNPQILLDRFLKLAKEGGPCACCKGELEFIFRSYYTAIEMKNRERHNLRLQGNSDAQDLSPQDELNTLRFEIRLAKEIAHLIMELHKILGCSDRFAEYLLMQRKHREADLGFVPPDILLMFAEGEITKKLQGKLRLAGSQLKQRGIVESTPSTNVPKTRELGNELREMLEKSDEDYNAGIEDFKQLQFKSALNKFSQSLVVMKNLADYIYYTEDAIQHAKVNIQQTETFHKKCFALIVLKKSLDDPKGELAFTTGNSIGGELLAAFIGLKVQYPAFVNILLREIVDVFVVSDLTIFGNNYVALGNAMKQVLMQALSNWDQDRKQEKYMLLQQAESKKEALAKLNDELKFLVAFSQAFREVFGLSLEFAYQDKSEKDSKERFFVPRDVLRYGDSVEELQLYVNLKKVKIIFQVPSQLPSSSSTEAMGMLGVFAPESPTPAANNPNVTAPAPASTDTTVQCPIQ